MKIIRSLIAWGHQLCPLICLGSQYDLLFKLRYKYNLKKCLFLAAIFFFFAILFFLKSDVMESNKANYRFRAGYEVSALQSVCLWNEQYRIGRPLNIPWWKWHHRYLC